VGGPELAHIQMSNWALRASGWVRHESPFPEE
jgi:hypothetical protein